MVAKSNLEELKRSFEHQRAEILSAIARREQEARALAGNEPEDAADKSVTNFSKEYLYQQLSKNCERLRKLDAALQRMRRGNFGICSNCGNEISLKRLDSNALD